MALPPSFLFERKKEQPAKRAAFRTLQLTAALRTGALPLSPQHS